MAAWLAGAGFGARADAASAPAACRHDVIGTGFVRDILDGRSFVLDDGRSVRLADLEVPPLPSAGETGATAAAGIAARDALRSLIAGRLVELRHRQAASDRYGRTIAHAEVVGEGAARNVARDLLARGHARVAVQSADGACLADLLMAERSARTAGLGLWSEPNYAIVAAKNGAGLLARRGAFTLAEGQVLSVRESGATIYMNFGRRWSDALTVTVWKRNERTFTSVGLAPKSLENRHVRVRGWVEDRNGPRIEASRPEQIEIAERN